MAAPVAVKSSVPVSAVAMNFFMENLLYLWPSASLRAGDAPVHLGKEDDARRLNGVWMRYLSAVQVADPVFGRFFGSKP
jgi:hypothetical protein